MKTSTTVVRTTNATQEELLSEDESMSTPATSTRGEFQNSLLVEITEEQDTNTNLSHSHSNINEI